MSQSSRSEQRRRKRPAPKVGQTLVEDVYIARNSPFEAQLARAISLLESEYVQSKLCLFIFGYAFFFFIGSLAVCIIPLAISNWFHFLYTTTSYNAGFCYLFSNFYSLVLLQLTCVVIFQMTKKKKYKRN